MVVIYENFKLFQQNNLSINNMDVQITLIIMVNYLYIKIIYFIELGYYGIAVVLTLYTSLFFGLKFLF